MWQSAIDAAIVQLRVRIAVLTLKSRCLRADGRFMGNFDPRGDFFRRLAYVLCVAASSPAAHGHLHNYLQNKRSKGDRTAFRDLFLAVNVWPLSEEVVDELDKTDALARA